MSKKKSREHGAGWAGRQLAKGLRVVRASWKNGEHLFDSDGVAYMTYGSEGAVGFPWTPDVEDMAARDWRLRT